MTPLPMRTPLLLLLASLLAAAPLSAEIAEPVSLYVEGYPNRLSYAQGEEAVFHIATSAPKFSATIERVGATRRKVWEKADLAGVHRPVPDDAAAAGCRWPETFRVQIGADWPSGYYAVTLKVQDSGGPWTRRGTRTAQGSLFFVVRPAKPAAKILIQLATNTYNAYTNYGGHSLYAYHAIAKNQGHRVSFERPLTSQFERWEQPFIAWCEKNGFALDYAVNSDLEFHPELLASYRLVLSVGHDEYWSAPMRDTLEAFIAKGGNAAFFSGNTCCWQVRSEDGGRALTCWKQNFTQDPQWQQPDRRTLSTLWSHHAVGRPENTMTGVGFLKGGYRKSHGQFMDGKAEYTVHRPEHWIFAGTHLKRGDVFGDQDTIVGYECDGCEIEWRDGLPYPTARDGTPKTFEVLATCPVRWHPDDAAWYERWDKTTDGNATLGTYTQGGTVFTTGSTDWAHGLKGGDPIVERITRNVLERLAR
jgi:hypothetical protein